jgi:hypothetical protein
VCQGKWTGDNCDQCSLTCLNGGTPSDDCTTCKCPIGWSGPLCDVPCTLVCKNGGTQDKDCKSCICADKWIGDQCNDCGLDCKNGGINDNWIDCKACSCPNNWGGENCEKCDLTCPNNTTISSDCKKCLYPPLDWVDVGATKISSENPGYKEHDIEPSLSLTWKRDGCKAKCASDASCNVFSFNKYIFDHNYIKNCYTASLPPNMSFIPSTDGDSSNWATVYNSYWTHLDNFALTDKNNQYQIEKVNNLQGCKSLCATSTCNAYSYDSSTYNCITASISDENEIDVTPNDKWNTYVYQPPT